MSYILEYTNTFKKDILYRKGEKKGEKRGEKRGEKKGAERTREQIVRNLIKVSNLSDEQIASAVNVTVSFVRKEREKNK